MNAASMRMLHFIKIMDPANLKSKIPEADINIYRYLYGTIYHVTIPYLQVTPWPWVQIPVPYLFSLFLKIASLHPNKYEIVGVEYEIIKRSKNQSRKKFTKFVLCIQGDSYTDLTTNNDMDRYVYAQPNILAATQKGFL
jgi:hypothetical protein